MTDAREQDIAAIQTVLADSYRAWVAGDADAMVADYRADATAIIPGSLRDGRGVIRDSMDAAFAGPLRGTSTWNEQRSVRFLGEDVAIVISETGILFPGETAVPENRRANATWVLHRQDAGWKIAAYHNSPAHA